MAVICKAKSYLFSRPFSKPSYQAGCGGGMPLIPGEAEAELCELQATRGYIVSTCLIQQQTNQSPCLSPFLPMYTWLSLFVILLPLYSPPPDKSSLCLLGGHHCPDEQSPYKQSQYSSPDNGGDWSPSVLSRTIQDRVLAFWVCRSSYIENYSQLQGYTFLPLEIK